MSLPGFSRRTAPLTLLLVTLAGCASYVPQPLSAQVSAARFEARSLDDPGLVHYLAAHRLSNSPRSWDVDTLTLAALYYNPELALARAQQNVAVAGVDIARQHPNPSLAFTPAYNTDALAGMSPWILGWVLSVPLETAGRRGYRTTQAMAQAAAARFHLAEVAWQVRSQVRSRLLDDVAAHQDAANLEQALALQEALLAAEQRRYAAGEAARPATAVAQAAVNAAQLQVNLAASRVGAARVALAAAIGVPVAALEHITLSCGSCAQLVPVAQLPGAAVQQAALTQRADLLAALAQYAASQSALQLEVAGQYPNLQIGPGYKWDQGADKWSLGISLTLPLFNHNQAQIAQAQAQRARAAAEFVALQAHAIAQAERALADYQAALATLDTAQALAATQQARMQSAQREFVSGNTDQSVLAAARLQALAADNTRQTAATQAQRALGALEDALERPLPLTDAPATPP